MKGSDATPALALAGTTAPEQITTKNTWNTKNLTSRLGADFLSAASAASMVAPIIAIIDRSIMENASGANTLANSVKSSLRALFTRPHTILFSKPTALIFCLYGGTYLTANAVDTSFSTVNNKPASSVTAGTTKFAASSAANIGVCIYKDQVFVRMFGPPGVVPRPVPLASYTLFALRDCLTIFASFNVPPLLGLYLDKRFSEEMKKRVSGLYAAQFLAPAMVQFISTPMHLFGLDLYNRQATGPGGAVVTMRDRLDLVRRNWFISSVARICRIVPAFGVGGVVNMKVRKNLMTKLE
ncbi:hypothetical protein F53441_10964 [Fusarium austroafricanum]|uniref:Sequence orphan n=1 Tax=Fusarium austroafricanum TaxID=2364996 RepID=A0A8H4K7H8_9HYPO|nr:hypothetical protein F53441_10964 [Fusarium austroafricanum]